MGIHVIGRDAELAAIDLFLERQADGATALLFAGEAGIGKTELWRAAVSRAQEAGFRILRCAPAESERVLAYGALTDLLAEVTEADLEVLAPVQRTALEVALLRARAAAAFPDQRALAVATAALLRSMASGSKLLIAIDDAQWLDESSAALLAYALRRVGPDRVNVALTLRGESAAARELLATIPRESLERVNVGPMNLAALHQLFITVLGRSFPRLVLVRIQESSGGNPLFALELARAVETADAALTPTEQLPVPQTLNELVGARVAALPKATRDALLLLAAAERPSVELLERTRPGAADDLEPAVSASIVAIGRGAIRFAHPFFAEAVRSSASPDDVRRAHALLAGVEGSAEARARHMASAALGPDAEIAEALAAAAAHARDGHAPFEAAAMYQQAGQLTPPELADRRIQYATLAAECLFIDVSEIVEADALLAAAVAQSPAGAGRAVALSLRALIRYYHGNPEEAVQIAEAALSEIGDDPIPRATVLGRASFLRMQLDMEAGLRQADEAVRLVAPRGLDDPLVGVDPDLLANVVLLRASAEFGLVRGLRSDEIERARRLISRDGRSWEHEGADGNSFGLARHTDDLDTAIAMTFDLIQSKSGPAGDDPFNLVQLSGLQLLRGDWPAARASAEAALDGYRREGAEVFLSWGLRGIALVDAHEGRVDDALRLSAQGLELATHSGNRVLEVFHRHILGFAALSLGDMKSASEHLAEAARSAESTGTLHPGRFKLDGDRLEVAVALGQLDVARAIAEHLERAVAFAPTPWVVAISARGRGLIHAAEGDLAAASSATDQAIAAHAALPMPFEKARTLLVCGRIHRRRKEKRLADERLREALAIFQDLGAPLWADMATAELGRIGLRPRAPSQLTDTERAVAELAAAGLNSREIAERVFLTPKSVGNVLGRVYEKLGIHSRAELGARMVGVEQEPATDRAGRD